MKYQELNHTSKHAMQLLRQVIAAFSMSALAISCGSPQKPVEFNNQQIAGSTNTFGTGTTAYDPSSGQVGATISGAIDSTIAPTTTTFDNSSSPFSGESLSAIPGVTQTGGAGETLSSLQEIGSNLGNIFGGGNQNTVSNVSSNNGGLFQNLFNQGNNSGGLFSNIGSGGGLFSNIGSGGGLFSNIGSGGGLLGGLFRR